MSDTEAPGTEEGRQTRTPRQSASREAKERATTWSPPSALPDPEPQDGWTFRWIRTSMVGQADNQNVSRRFREGWEPVKRTEIPKLGLEDLIPDRDTAFTDSLEVGGLLLCKIPTEMMQQRRSYYEQRADQQLKTVDNNYMSEDHPKMKKFADRKTRVSFGQGKPASES